MNSPNNKIIDIQDLFNSSIDSITEFDTGHKMHGYVGVAS